MERNNLSFEIENIQNYSKIKKKYKNQCYNIVEINGQRINSVQEIFNSFSIQLKFPDYFGDNWDAFFDCLKDLMWLKTENTAILIKYHELLTKKNLISPLYDILKDSRQFWKKFKIDFRIILFKR